MSIFVFGAEGLVGVLVAAVVHCFEVGAHADCAESLVYFIGFSSYGVFGGVRLWNCKLI